MKDQHDSKTLEIPAFPLPRRRGRPKTGHALTPAQKQAAYRARKAQAAREGQGGDSGDARTYSREYVEGLERRVATLQALADDLDSRNQALFDKLESKESHIKNLLREQTRLQGRVDELASAREARISAASKDGPSSFDLLDDFIGYLVPTRKPKDFPFRSFKSLPDDSYLPIDLPAGFIRSAAAIVGFPLPPFKEKK